MSLLSLKAPLRALLPCAAVLVLGALPRMASAEPTPTPAATATPGPTPAVHPGKLRFSEANYSVSEGAGTATITVQRYDGADGNIGVHYATDSGTAKQPGDYTATSGQIYFVAGDTTPKTFTVPIIDDSLVEPDETISLNLSAPQGGAVLNATLYHAVLTIKDNDTGPTPTPIPTATPKPTPTPTATPEPHHGRLRFSESGYSVNEGAGTATITVQRVDGADGIVSAHYATVEGGSATVGADYTATGDTITFAAGDVTPKTFKVTIKDDTVVENPETVYLLLTEPKGGATLDTAFYKAALTIVDNDTAPPVDKTAPTVAFVHPLNATSVPNLNEITGTAKDEVGGSGLATVTLQIRRLSDGLFWSGTAWVTNDPQLPTTLTDGKWVRSSGNPAGNLLLPGQYALRAYATDKAGNRGSAVINITVEAVDQTPPQITIDVPGPDAVLQTLPYIVGTATDDQGISRVTFTLQRVSDQLYWSGTKWAVNATQLETTLDGTKWRRTSGLPPEFSVSSTQNPPEHYRIFARAFDKAGNSATAGRGFSLGSTTPPKVLGPSGDSS